MIDVVVAGAGPLGASAAYHLARHGMAVTVVFDDSVAGSYRNSGGSLCWHRPDPRRAAAIEETATFVRTAVSRGAAIDCRDVPYLCTHEGVLVPALNISSPDLVEHLLDGARAAGAGTRTIGRVQRVERVDHRYRLHGTEGVVEARAVVLALGVGNVGVMPGLEGTFETRQLFVLDLPVDADRARWPHTIVPIGDAYAYVFVKRFEDGLRIVVGHEDLVDDGDPSGPVDSFAELLAAGVGERFPWLRDGSVDEILWGLDWADSKLPHVETDGHRLWSVNAGSGVRVCIPAGRQVTGLVTTALALGR